MRLIPVYQSQQISSFLQVFFYVTYFVTYFYNFIQKYILYMVFILSYLYCYCYWALLSLNYICWLVVSFREFRKCCGVDIKSPDTGPEIPGLQSQLSHFTGCVTLEKWFQPSVLQFPHLKNENSSTYLIMVIVRIKLVGLTGKYAWHIVSIYKLILLLFTSHWIQKCFLGFIKSVSILSKKQ